MRQPPAERFVGAEHIYNLADLAAQLRDEPHAAKDGHRQMTIAHQRPVTLVLFDFEQGGDWLDHVTDGLVTIHTLTGHIPVTTPEGRHEPLDDGSLRWCSHPGVAHDLYATVHSTVLLTVHLEPKAERSR